MNENRQDGPDREWASPRPVRRVPKPWGYEIIFAHTDRYVGKILHINAGESLSLQYHERKEETLYLLSGRVRLTLRSGDDEAVRVMEPGQSYHIAPYLIHRMEAIEESDIAEVSTTELDDVVRLEDRYGREGTSEA
jgi:mannose-6-phosphate isomerase